MTSNAARSYDAPSAELRERLLHGMLQTAPTHGWSQAALNAGARVAGLTAGEAALAAPGGPLDLADAFSLWADDRMADRLAASPLANMKVRARVTLAVRARIEALAPHKEAMRRKAAALTVAGPMGPAPRLAWRTSDRMWSALGDRSTDENYYSKRAILAVVNTATLARWLTESDPAAAATWAFLDKRIEGVMRFERIKGRLAGLSTLGDAAAAGLARLRYGAGRP